MNSRRVSACFVAAVLPLTGSGCIVVSVGGCSRVWTEATTARIPIDTVNLHALEVRTHNGSITYAGQPAEASEAFVAVTRKGGGRTHAAAEEALEAIEVYVERVGAETQRLGWRWKEVKRPGWAAQVSFDIRGPSRVRLDGQTHNGAVNVESSKGKLYAETHNGRVVASYAGDDVTLTTHNGGVVADLNRCGAMKGEITTHNGSVEVVVGDRTSADLTCRTHNGSIKCDVPLDDGLHSRRKLTGRIGTGEGKLNITTHNGSVRIRETTG